MVSWIEPLKKMEVIDEINCEKLNEKIKGALVFAKYIVIQKKSPTILSFKDVKHYAYQYPISMEWKMQLTWPILILLPLSLSGLCTLNFSAAESLLSTTATDCWASFAPYLANVVCCPQLDATLVTLIGQSSKQSGMLALNMTHSKHCLSDVENILESRGANTELQKLCSIQPGNLTGASCPVIDVDTFESIVDSARLLAACDKVDPVNECCDQVCQNAISDSARKIALNGMSSTNGAHVLPEHLTRIDDCKNIVRRWLTSKLDPPSANSILRGLSNCKINEGNYTNQRSKLKKVICSSSRIGKIWQCLKHICSSLKPYIIKVIINVVLVYDSACPLVFPSIKNVVGKCGDMKSNETACCKEMETYMSHLQEQSFITNMQALNCAASLGIKLQKANVSSNIYSLCHINLKDFSVQG